MVEKMLQWYGPCHDVQSVSLRYFNAAGASFDAAIGEDWKVTLNLVPVALRAALERGPKITVFGTDYPTPDGTCIRDYIHVDDLADAHVKALEYLERGGSTTSVNLGTGKGSSVLDVIKTLENVSGVQVPHILGPRRPGDPIAVFADNTKAREVLVVMLSGRWGRSCSGLSSEGRSRQQILRIDCRRWATPNWSL